MLAGKMKLNHFLALAGLVAVGVVVALFFTCDGDSEPGAPAPDIVSSKPIAKAPSEPKRAGDKPGAEPQPQPAADGPSERPVDRAVMRYRGMNLGAAKKKDVTKGEAFKINVYQDSGNATANRAKIDLDRNGKWDEKWTFDGDRIKRKVAPADDENYTEEYEWGDGGWKKK